jgi:hypothetical protein
MIIIANDDGKKMVEAMELEPFLDEYVHVTGTELTVVAAGERPDFICKKHGRCFGLELVKAMQDHTQRVGDIIFRGESHLHGVDAAMLVQETVYLKEGKRASVGWRYPKSAILVIQLIGSDGEEMAQFLDDQLMDEMAATGFHEIWIADYSPMAPYRTVQLVGVKPKRWRGAHQHRFFGTKPYG